MAPTELAFARLPGVRVGHALSSEGSSGVTVIRFDRAAPMVVQIPGGASATYDTGSLALDATFGRRWAVFFSGGSLYGLDAARGVRTRLLEEGDGHTAFANPNAILPITGAALFDLPGIVGPLPDYLPLGYEAARTASRDRFPDGRIGAGAGATVGKYLGRARAMAGGVGSAAERTSGGHVGVLSVVNAAGAVRDPDTGRWMAGAKGPNGRIVPPRRTRTPPSEGTHTTLTLAVTDVSFGRGELARIATEVAAGVARAVVPYGTAFDGDVVFAVSTERRAPSAQLPIGGGRVDAIARAAADLAALSVVRAVRGARPR